MRFFFFFLCVSFSFNAVAANLRDSIGVENHNGNQLITHKVQPKETYYSIARLYHVSPKNIIEHNHNIPLQIGTIIKVPTNRPFALATNNQVQSAVNDNIIEYKVGRKDHLYSIAKRFNTTIETIKELNNLKSENLSVGQILKIRQGYSIPVIEVVPATTSTETSDEEESEKLQIPMGRLGLSERTERGVAVWITDENLDGTKMMALHRTAPIGTVVKITNPMTDRVTFAKVVGKFTENESTKDVILVVTKATAELLGALDKRFQVTIDYGMPNE